MPNPVFWPKRAIRRPRSFTCLLASTLSAAVGRNGYYIASAWILVEEGHGSAAVAVFLVIVSATELVASPVAGVAADCFDRRRLNIVSDLARFAAALGTAAALLYVDVFLTICVSAILFSLCDRVALTASQSMIPGVAAHRSLAAANSLVFFIMQFGNLGAALLSGILLHECPPALTFAILSWFFFISACFMVPMRPERASVSGKGVTARTATAPDVDLSLLRISAVYAFLYASAVLVSVMGSSFIFAEQGGSAVDFGHLEAAWSAGSILGAVLLVPLGRATNTSTLHLMILGATAVTLMALKLLHPPWTLIVFAAVGILYNLGRVSVEVSVQSIVSEDALGRAKGIIHSVGVALGTLVFGITAVVGDKINPSTIFFGFGVVLFLGASILSVPAIRREKRK
ncbi:hypothetical protein CDO26_23460 (plasmid) [Sinorhizobium meliloti]|uniref:MFS transporter n=1 Tax=Rhizobium meliloti TaxID=382 RepID=UPI000B49A745|nr:MFS transporter [Sinorhizobium meliloti]ASP87352.1 hypothetical protein CDO26_23460 [Sinorhizobium meliloti]MQW29258.1 MFS transporter [Sinorhizobium meliloti]